jgi:hypothetical protein
VRVERGWAAVLAVVGAVLCFVPLFDVLGYEWCLVMGVLSSLAGAHIGAVRVWRERWQRAGSAVTAAEAHPGTTVGRLWWRATLATWAGLLVPVAAILLNALRVRNCDPAGGLAWLAMMPVLSAAMGAGAGTVAGLLRAWRGRMAPSALALGIVVASVACGVWRFYAAPPIFGYDPFVGYFAGTLYDEEVAITGAFLWARLYQGALVAFWLALSGVLLDARRLSLRAPSLRARPLALAVAAGLVAVWLWQARAQLGFALDAGDIARRLGGEKRTAHFVLHYSPTGPYAKELDAYAADDEFWWHELERWFGAAPAPPVHAFLFDNVAQKRALMGAGHTFIAKPWRREIYLQYDAWPQTVTRHELAHVFAGPFGDPIFGIARRGLAFNVGLIEGVAVAAAWNDKPLTAHQTVKVLRDAGLVDAATIERIMGPSFFGINAAQAYSIAGSFCRFLADTRGVDKLMQLYRAAGARGSWQRIYGTELAALAAEWLRLVDEQAVPERERQVALARLKRPSIFRRPCAHALALHKQAARDAAQAGDKARALREWDTVCRDEPTPENQLDRIRAAMIAGDLDGAAHLLAATHSGDDAASAGQVAMLRGDLDLSAGRDPARAYDEAAAAPLDESNARLATVKQTVAHWPSSPARTALLQILAAPAGTRDAALDLVTLQKLSDAEPERTLLHYLIGRQLYTRNRWADAADELGRRGREPLPDARFEREAVRLRAAALYRLGRCDEARPLLRQLAGDSGADVGVRLEAFEFLARCDFAEGRP